MMEKTVGIVGLGRMGMPAAKVLIKAGYHVIGYARRREVIDEFVAMGGESVPDYRSVAEMASKVIVFVLDDAQVIEVVTSENGLLAGCGDQSVIICMATINKENLEWVAAQCARKKVGFIDLPCTGGPARIEAGTLTMIAGAPGVLIDACRPLLEKLGHIVHVGEAPGMGQAAKHCNQLLVTVTHAAIMEILLMAEKGGLDPYKVSEVIGSGICGSDYFRLTVKSVLDGTPHPGGFGQLCKDMYILINSGRKLKLPLLVATAAQQYFLAADSLGLQGEASVMMKAVERLSEPDR
jgi:3-hydroxyisobutyrate dehydrogenase-like beta-hydroxyacid dehydrogenase